MRLMKGKPPSEPAVSAAPPASTLRRLTFAASKFRERPVMVSSLLIELWLRTCSRDRVFRRRRSGAVVGVEHGGYRHGARLARVTSGKPLEQHSGGMAREHRWVVADMGEPRPHIFELRQVV